MKEIVVAVMLIFALLGTAALINLAPENSGIVNANLESAHIEAEVKSAANRTYHRTAEVDGLEIFYREAGSRSNPTILLLHGFPTSSHMFRNLIEDLSDEFHLIAPDYPGFGNSSMPPADQFEYTFDNISRVVEQLLDQLNITRYSIYIQDYGAPVGLRLASKYPEQVESLIIQNGNAYEEGLLEFWDPFRAYWSDPNDENASALRGFLNIDATIWQFTHGVRNVDTISPDNWIVTQASLDRRGNQEVQLELFFDYQSNLGHYPAWQSYFRQYQPPTLIVWGKNDVIFPAEGAYPYQRDLTNLEFHLLDTGHFALEEDGELIAGYIRDFLHTNGITRN